MKRSALLLDTHVWLWLSSGDRDRFSRSTLRAIEDAPAIDGILISVMSVWEMALLEAKGRLKLSFPVLEWAKRALEAPEYRLVGMDTETAVESCFLPGHFHADPADRFLVATARLKNVPLVTRDERILEYSEGGFVRTVPA